MTTTHKTPKGALLYARVSSREQGRSGLSLTAQVEALEAFAKTLGLPVRGTAQEVASGGAKTLTKRPQLKAAILRARRENLAILCLRPDRLGRNLALALRIIDEVPVRFADSPHASDLEVALRLTVAAEERRLIALRTKEALAVRIAQGAKLGSRRPGHWRGLEHRRRAGAASGGSAKAAVAQGLRGDLPQRLAAYAAQHKTSSPYRLAILLNIDQDTDLRPIGGGERWDPTQVKRLLEQAQQARGDMRPDWIELPLAL